MKYFIKGVRPVQFVNDNTGEVIEGVSLYCEYKDANVFGMVTDRIFVKTDKPYYSQIKPYVEDTDKTKSPIDLVGKSIRVDRGRTGGIIDFELEIPVKQEENKAEVKKY